MKKLLLIATGGTIACCETENGLSPALSGTELLQFYTATQRLLHSGCL